ncbi:MAG: EAL domain-containing protein [Lachnospiraceae bacterium]|nr:EAL domain-containing protein [Lachnospiraceae bacterium]
MANNKELRFRKLKKNRLWVSILFLTLFTVIAHALLILFVSYFFFHLIDQKLQNEYDRVAYVARLYEDGKLLSVQGRSDSYLILDANGQILEEHGKDTRADISGYISMSGVEDPVTVYPDREQAFITILDSGIAFVDIPEIYRFLKQDPEESVLLQLLDENKSIDMPVWISVPMDQGRAYVGKANFTVYTKDVIVLLIFAAAMALMIFVILLIMLISIINHFSHQRKLISVFFTDEVTGAHNWMWMLIRGEQMLKKRSNASKNYAILNILFMEYRNFCVCHSIAEGEAMLYKVDRTIANDLRRNEMSAHCSSASFAVLMQYNTQEQLKQRIEELVGRLEKIDRTHRFAYKVGACLLEPERENGKIVRRRHINIEEAYNNACAARDSLPDGEESGIAFFDETLVEEQRWIDSVRERQESALQNEEFVVYYQPKYDPKTHELRGAEALVRWDSKDLGFVPPGRFIPIFEKNGFIPKIDHYMLEHVAADQKRWLDEGLSCVPVSVNISRAHFIESDLAEQILRIVDSVGTPHELIELEVTESAFFDDKKAMIDTINRLKGYGFAVSMDDFGSGYSSLNSLKDMPLDVLKLDAEFFRGNTQDGRGEIVVAEAVKLAKNLHMRTVAEGVEIKEQVDFLAELGCDMIQGYYFAKPMPKDEYVTRLQNKQDENTTNTI